MAVDAAYITEISRLMEPFLRLNREGMYRFGETEDVVKRTAKFKFECLGGGTYQVADPDEVVWNAYIWQISYQRNENRQFEFVTPDQRTPLISIEFEKGDLRSMAQSLEDRQNAWKTDYPRWALPNERIVIEKTIAAEDWVKRQVLDGPTLRMMEHLAAFSILWELELVKYKLNSRFRDFENLRYYLDGIRNDYRQAILKSIRTEASLIA